MSLHTRLLQGDTLHKSYDVMTGPSYWFESPYQSVSHSSVCEEVGLGNLDGANDNLFSDATKSQSFKLAVPRAIELITETLRGHRFVFSIESTLQEEIRAVLMAAGIPFSREHRLAPRDRVDFLIGRIGVEVKIKGTKRGILRQLQRYAESPAIAGLLLVSNVSTGLPETINGKPVHSLSLGEAWL